MMMMIMMVMIFHQKTMITMTMMTTMTTTMLMSAFRNYWYVGAPNTAPHPSRAAVEEWGKLRPAVAVLAQWRPCAGSRPTGPAMGKEAHKRS